MFNLDIIIDNEKYSYVDSITINNKNYVAYTDGEITSISEYILKDDNVEFIALNDEEFNMVKEAMKL